MTKISILYPNKEDGRFDKDYYLNIHMPLSIEKQGAALKGISVEIGIYGGIPDTKPPYIAMCHLLYDSLGSVRTACRAAYGRHNKLYRHSTSLSGKRGDD